VHEKSSTILMKLGITSQNLKDFIFTRCDLMKNISSIEDASNTNKS
jgi:hypothetical protein